MGKRSNIVEITGIFPFVDVGIKKHDVASPVRYVEHQMFPFS